MSAQLWGGIVLKWTPTASPRVTGYHIYRSSVAGKLGALVATVNPSTTTTWTDTTASATSYYVIKSYYALWEAASAESVGTVPVLVYDNFSGPKNTTVAAAEVGGVSWKQLNGTWSLTGAGEAVTTAPASSNPLLAVDMGTPDVDVRVTTTGDSGTAAYVRVKDADDWLRARVKSVASTRTYSPIEYEHPTYFTDLEYTTTLHQKEVNLYTTQYQYQDYITEYQWEQVDYGTWSSWSQYTTSGCQPTAADVLLPNDTDTDQYRLTNKRKGSCTGSNYLWDKETRHRGKSTLTRWSDTQPAGYSKTGTWRKANVGSPYWGDPHSWSVDVVSSRNVYTGTSWTGFSSTVTAPDVATGNTRWNVGALWWTIDNDNTFTAYKGNPCGFAAAIAGADYGGCYISNTRAGAQTGTYWDRNPCSCNSRTASYTVTDPIEVWAVVLDRSVAGTITQIGSWSLSAQPSNVRVVTSGSSISVYRDTSTLLGSVTSTALQSETKHGAGLGGNDTLTPSSTLTYAYVAAV